MGKITFSFFSTLSVVCFIVLFSCKSRDYGELNSRENPEATGKQKILDELSHQELKDTLMLIAAGANDAEPYDFRGVNGALCKGAFQGSRLDDEAKASLVGILHYLEREKAKIIREREVARQSVRDAELSCLKENELKTPARGISAIIRRNPGDTVSQDEKQRRITNAELNLGGARMCLQKQDAIILGIDHMIKNYDNIYQDSLGPEAALVREQEEQKRAFVSNLLTLAQYQLALLNSLKIPEGSLDTTFLAAQKIHVNTLTIKENEISIERLLRSNENNRQMITAPQTPELFKGIRDADVNLSATGEKVKLVNLARVAESNASTALMIYESFSERLGDIQKGVGQTNSASQFAARCSIFAATEGR
jgi:hypothetical protein